MPLAYTPLTRNILPGLSPMGPARPATRFKSIIGAAGSPVTVGEYVDSADFVAM